MNLTSSHNLFGPLQAKNILVNVTRAREVNFENYCVTGKLQSMRDVTSPIIIPRIVQTSDCQMSNVILFKYQNCSNIKLPFKT